MGSYDYTCCVSDLPIRAEDPVRYLLLAENPYQEGVSGLWVPRTFPLKAHYNDYGCINKTSKTLFNEVFLASLKKDLVERGVGDNSYHDVPVRKDMDFDTLIEAVQRKRVLVHQKGRNRSIPDSRTPEGVPTLKRVRKAMAECPLSDGGREEGYSIDLQKRGFVRIRWYDNSNAVEQLTKLLPLFSDYAAMISAGTGGYARLAQLLLGPKPGNYTCALGVHSVEFTRHLKVRQAMIREDVWQALCQLPYDSEDVDTPKTAQGFRALARVFWQEARDVADIKDTRLRQAQQFAFRYSGTGNVVAALTRDGLGMARGLGLHFDLMVQRNPKVHLEEFLDTVGEMAFVHCILSNLRYQWRPSNSSGPQYGEWKLHNAYHLAMAKVAQGIKFPT
jgi:hypothetical protein